MQIVQFLHYKDAGMTILTCPPPSSLHRSIANAKSIAANTASASVLWEARISCRRLSYITGSKKAKSCQFTYKKRQMFETYLFKNILKTAWPFEMMADGSWKQFAVLQNAERLFSTEAHAAATHLNGWCPSSQIPRLPAIRIPPPTFYCFLQFVTFWFIIKLKSHPLFSN